MRIKLNGKALLGLAIFSSSFVFADFVAILTGDIIVKEVDTTEPGEEILPVFEVVHSSSGFCKKWSNGFMECYGSVANIASAEVVTVNYPYPFKAGSRSSEGSLNDSNEVYTILSSKLRNSYRLGTGMGGEILENDNVSFKIRSQTGVSNSTDWISTGYWK